MKPVCIKCHRFYRPKKNGFPVIEGMPIGPGRVEPGLTEADKWQPYKLWHGDLWECQGCENQIVVGFPNRPISEHFEEGFEKDLESFGATFQVNDC